MEFYKVKVLRISLLALSFNSNGMEFYPNTLSSNEISGCFNSQRDGILLSIKRIFHLTVLFQFPTGWNSTLRLWTARARICVSIPNGMEFYLKISYRVLMTKCFNSQRDGILRSRYARCLCFDDVSIPNGMKFYVLCSLGNLCLLLVSIPNGMKFYAGSYALLIRDLEFQFPTGWNSTKRPIYTI